MTDRRPAALSVEDLTRLLHRADPGRAVYIRAGGRLLAAAAYIDDGGDVIVMPAQTEGGHYGA